MYAYTIAGVKNTTKGLDVIMHGRELHIKGPHSGHLRETVFLIRDSGKCYQVKYRMVFTLPCRSSMRPWPTSVPSSQTHL